MQKIGEKGHCKKLQSLKTVVKGAARTCRKYKNVLEKDCNFLQKIGQNRPKTALLMTVSPIGESILGPFDDLRSDRRKRPERTKTAQKQPKNSLNTVKTGQNGREMGGISVGSSLRSKKIFLSRCSGYLCYSWTPEK